jgi:hypothetical protein
MKRLLVAALSALALAGCSSGAAPVPLQAPQWSAVPPAVLDAFCAKIHEEAISRETPIVVLKTTQPLVTGNALMAVRNAYFVQKALAAPPSETAQRLRAQFTPLPLTIPAEGCSWKAVSALNRELHGDVMVLQLSNPFLNPYMRNDAGMLARFSLGDANSEWYWIPFAYEHKTHMWRMGRILMLNMHED